MRTTTISSMKRTNSSRYLIFSRFCGFVEQHEVLFGVNVFGGQIVLIVFFFSSVEIKNFSE
jgi:hypothetical protein